MNKTIKVVVFGSFDPLHDGHRFLFNEAKKLGDDLTVIVARDSSIRNIKGREPEAGEERRRLAVAGESAVDRAILGNEGDRFRILDELDADVVALGYDQEPDDATIRDRLDRLGKRDVRVARLGTYQPHKYKSSLLRQARED
ncbi:MAG: adenylyltransferase/cytidyltransferase family protein [Candidatus Andersenbacteria bacterium]|nr:adenylyltransferase/cytidyltransferase family protein [bacterium]MDZ4225460.1 adenylyltransferase/cytidyltransferase family protein [Candidatus Andersenbacteria bacterium]